MSDPPVPGADVNIASARPRRLGELLAERIRDGLRSAVAPEAAGLPFQGVATDGAETVTSECIALAVATLLRERAGFWTGTAADLLALLPPGSARDATRLSKRLRDAAVDLATRGVTVERNREAGTGRRLVTLRVALPIHAGRGPSSAQQAPQITGSAATRRQFADALATARANTAGAGLGRGE